MDTMLDIVFRGNSYSVDYSYLQNMLAGSRNLLVNSPEGISVNSYEDIVVVLKEHNYVDISFGTDNLNIGDITIKNTFINITKNRDLSDVLFFFDAKDIGLPAFKSALNALRIECKIFKEYYKFDMFICQMDNATEGEYYFDGNGLGPFYFTVDIENM